MALLAISGNEVQLRLSYGGRTRINESRCFGFHGDMLYPDDEIAGGSVLTRMNCPPRPARLRFTGGRFFDIIWVEDRAALSPRSADCGGYASDGAHRISPKGRTRHRRFDVVSACAPQKTLPSGLEQVEAFHGKTTGGRRSRCISRRNGKMARNQFGGFGGPNMQQLMRQAQKMQEQMQKAQEDLDEQVYEASAGGGMVTCKVSGKRELLEIQIKPEAVDPDDVDMLQDLILAAVNEALRAGEKAREETMGKLAPAGMGGLF